MNLFIYDIETIPLDAAALARVEPEFEAPSNYKDPHKIAEVIAEKRAAWRERAALSALTGRVAMIGTRVNDDTVINSLQSSILDDPAACDAMEREFLAGFWKECLEAINYGHLIVGFNSHGFDIPFMVRRSWALGVAVPSRCRGRLSMPFVDLMREFTMGAPNEYVGLDAVAKFLGVGGKIGNGLQVATLLRSDPAAAVAYLTQDLALTQSVARKMGLEHWGPAAPDVPVDVKQSARY